MTLRKRKDTVIERGSTRSHCLENWLWKRLWACRQIDEGKKERMNKCMNE
jgi:hypothetical protein